MCRKICGNQSGLTVDSNVKIVILLVVIEGLVRLEGGFFLMWVVVARVFYNGSVSQGKTERYLPEVPREHQKVGILHGSGILISLWANGVRVRG